MFKSLSKESLQVFLLKDYRNFVLGRFLLTLAIQMQMTTIGLQAYYEYGKDYFVLGLVSLFEAIPFIISCFFAGHAADVYSRRKIILIGTFCLLLGSVLLYAFCLPSFRFLKEYSYYPLLSVVVIFGVTRAFLASSMAPFMSQLTERSMYTHAATWNSTFWHIGAILGPVVAAGIYGYNNELNAKATYLVNCLLFVAGAIAFLRISEKATERSKEETIMESLKAGLKFVFKTKMLLSALSLDLFAVLFGGAVVILPAFNDQILHCDPEAFGLLRTSPAIGAVISALIMAFYPPRKKAGRDLLLGVIGFGIFTIAFAFCTNYWLAFFMLAMTGAFDNISVVVRHSILQLMTPDNMRGRVSAVNSIFIGSSNEIGGVESSIAAKAMGLVPSIVFGGGMTIITVAVINRLNKKLKKLDISKYQ
ncbi:MAG: MFS transporter [Bacteroidota bacterium]|nr:MFS transporter [Bacteroidota bacterium]